MKFHVNNQRSLPHGSPNPCDEPRETPPRAIPLFLNPPSPAHDVDESAAPAATSCPLPAWYRWTTHHRSSVTDFRAARAPGLGPALSQTESLRWRFRLCTPKRITNLWTWFGAGNRWRDGDQLFGLHGFRGCGAGREVGDLGYQQSRGWEDRGAAGYFRTGSG